MDGLLDVFQSQITGKKAGPRAPAHPPKEIPYFAEKRVLVTGASSGIGRAVAAWFLNEGAYVALVGRDLDSLTELGRQFPTQALAIQCDLGSDSGQYDMCSAMMQNLGGEKTHLDVLVNAAGVIFDGDVENTYPQDYDYIADLNLRAAFHITSLLVEFLEKAKGVVVNVSSCFGSRPQCGMVSYCMSKAGLESLTKCCALELAPNGVRVNAVSPGTTDTNFLLYAGYSAAEYEAYKSRLEPLIPLQRIATPEEIAKAIIFLCSEKARHITGHIMKVDGGRSLTSSGFVKWEGEELMNRRFEPEAPHFFSYYTKKVTDLLLNPVSHTKGTPEWVQTKQTSNWATHMEEAHLKVLQGYSKLDPEADILKKMANEENEPITKSPMKMDPKEVEDVKGLFKYQS